MNLLVDFCLDWILWSVIYTDDILNSESLAASPPMQSTRAEAATTQIAIWGIAGAKHGWVGLAGLR